MSSASIAAAPPMQQISLWAKRGGLAVLDQGLFSGANFLVFVLLARWLVPEEYGGFAVAYSIFLSLALFHTAILTEPMMVLAPGKFVGLFRNYLGLLLYVHWVITGITALFLAGGAFVAARLGSAAMAQAMGGLAIAAPFLLLLWLVRRACHAHDRPGWSVVASAANFAIALGGLALLWRMDRLSTFSSLLTLGVAALAASLISLAALRPRLYGFTGNPALAEVIAEHRQYAKWSLLGAATHWASGQTLTIVLIPGLLGLTASAVVAATRNLFRPVSLAMQSLSLLLLPAFSKLAQTDVPGHRWNRAVLNATMLAASGAFFYGLIVSVLAQRIMHLLYGGLYDAHWMLAIFFALSSTLSIAKFVLGAALKSVGKVAVVSKARVASAAVVLILGIPAIVMWGLEGALGVGVLGNVVAGAIIAREYANFGLRYMQKAER